MEKKKPVYIRCPRCELNYIQKKDKYCSVCLHEMSLKKEDEYLDELETEICPICKVNYIHQDEVMCSGCLKERQLEDGTIVLPEEEIAAVDEWETYATRDDADEFVAPDEETGDMASITDLDDQELDLDIDEDIVIAGDIEFDDTDEDDVLADEDEDDLDLEDDFDDFEDEDEDEEDDY